MFNEPPTQGLHRTRFLLFYDRKPNHLGLLLYCSELFLNRIETNLNIQVGLNIHTIQSVIFEMYNSVVLADAYCGQTVISNCPHTFITMVLHFQQLIKIWGYTRLSNIGVERGK